MNYIIVDFEMNPVAGEYKGVNLTAANMRFMHGARMITTSLLQRWSLSIM